MNKENDDKLCAAFPLLYADRRGDIRQTAMAWGFDCGDGWFDLIWDMSAKLEEEIKKEVRSDICGYCSCGRLIHEGDGSLGKCKEVFGSPEGKFGERKCCCTGFVPYHPRACQLKEKFGALRLYMTSQTEAMEAIIREAEERSAITCEVCGQSGKISGRGWSSCLCDECRGEKP